MKKILILFPLIGICSSLFAQAPKVENVNAMQKVGTKYVIIKADISGKDDNGAMAQVYIEVWFKLNDTDTDWTKVTNLKSLFSETEDPSLSGEIPYNEGADVDPTTGSMIPVSFDAGMIGPAVESKIFAWDAGKQSENFKSDTAKIRIIAFYPKKDEFNSIRPGAEQVSGWNGTGAFSLGGTPGGS